MSKTFGYYDEDVDGDGIENSIMGSAGVPAFSGTADSISAFIESTTANRKMKCALYTFSDPNWDPIANGVTEERTITAGVGYSWQTFNFVGTKPIITADTLYVILIWGEQVAGEASLSYTEAEGDCQYYKGVIYNGFPGDLALEEWDWYHSNIYCTYTPAAPPRVPRPTAAVGNPYMF